MIAEIVRMLRNYLTLINEGGYSPAAKEHERKQVTAALAWLEKQKD